MDFESEIPKEEIEDVVDLEAKLINAHEELEKHRRMYKKSKTHMIEFEEKNKDAERIIANLKNQVLEVERTENNLEQHLKKKIQESKRLEQDIMHLRKKLDQNSIKSKFENNSRTLDES